MTASREIGKKAQKEPMSKWGFQPPNGAQILKFSKVTYRFLKKSNEVSMIQNSKYLDKFFITFILINYTKKSKK